MTAPEMVDGLGLAETLPGPLIKVTQFVGFLAAWRDPAPFSPVAAGIAGSALTTWVTFAFPMLLIFALAPFVEALRANTRLSGALAAVTAAVVGVILNLTVWFAMHVLVDWQAGLLALIAAGLMFGLRRGLIETVAAMALLGVLFRFFL
jgi:chromate transporter